jgi:flagellar FliL protein
MADGDDIGGPAKAARKRPNKKQLMIGAAAAVILVGAGGYVVLGGGGEDGVSDVAGADGPAAYAGQPKATAFVELPEMTVNLATVDPDKRQYVRLSVALEVGKAETAEAIRPMMPRVLDSFQTHLRELRPSDIRGSSGVYRLKEELLRRVNVAVAPARVEAVLFKDIVVQ